MSEMLKYLSKMLNRYYGAVVEQPMPWKVIDKLVTLEEVEENRPTNEPARAPHDPVDGSRAIATRASRSMRSPR
jgi:hypothetical protein